MKNWRSFMQVEPIRDMKDIKSIKKLLSSQPRNLLLFTLGINSALRASDILGITIGQVRYANVGDRITVKEKKTGKSNVFMMNKEIKYALDSYLKTVDAKDDDFLFKSRKGSNAPLSVHAVTKYVKEWCNAIHLHIHAGSHTLRKTWCFQQRIRYGSSWELISRRLAHHSPSITRTYLGIQEEEVEKILMKSI